MAKYIEHKNKAVKTDKRFEHVMALSLAPNRKDGVIRCITSRTGEYGTGGQLDRSVIHIVEGKTLEKFEIKEKIKIKNQDKIIKELCAGGLDFLGLEDPDIFVDPKTKLTHLYFTLPIIDNEKKKSYTHLGHAVGKDLNSLTMTTPVLMADKHGGAKELSIAPLNKKGLRYNLVESYHRFKGTYYSVVRLAIAKDMGKGWKFGKIVFHPHQCGLSWIAGHASPGPLLPTSFIDIGPSKRVGIMNGCVTNKIVKGKTKYGTFSVGLFIYDFEKGNIDWVSPKSFLQDSAVSKIRAITFASAFVETKKGEGILYAHVDDSFVRAYTIKAEDIKKLLPKA